MVVLSTNSQLVTSWDFRSLIINTNNHGPNLFPSVTPERTSPHSEKRSCDSLARFFSVCQEVGHPARNAWGIFKLKIFCKRIWWSIRSKAFLYSNITTLTAAPVSSVAWAQLWIIDIRICAVEDFGLS